MGLLDRLRGVARVTQGEHIVIEVASGVADERSSLACTSDVRFQLGSVSKQFTAAAILLLADRGALAVGDPVGRWIPGCPSSWGRMTIHHLLTHTAGLPHWPDLPGVDLASHLDGDEEINLFQATPLRSEPGQSWYYSSPGYVLLAHIVQLAADQAFADFLDTHLFQPLEMERTFVGNGSAQDLLARGYENGVAAPPFELDVVCIGAGDAWSTVGDMARWDAALAAGTFLSQASRRSMLARQASIPHEGAGDSGPLKADAYGYAWLIGTALGRRALYHPGGNAGFVALNAWCPNEDLRIVVLSNEGTADLEALLPELLAGL